MVISGIRRLFYWTSSRGPRKYSRLEDDRNIHLSFLQFSALNLQYIDLNYEQFTLAWLKSARLDPFCTQSTLWTSLSNLKPMVPPFYLPILILIIWDSAKPSNIQPIHSFQPIVLHRIITLQSNSRSWKSPYTRFLNFHFNLVVLHLLHLVKNNVVLAISSLSELLPLT